MFVPDTGWWARDVMGLEIGDGTAQIMMMVIAREKSRDLG